jgi:hypothetical protein
MGMPGGDRGDVLVLVGNEGRRTALLHYFEHQRADSGFLERASLMTAALGVG